MALAYGSRYNLSHEASARARGEKGEWIQDPPTRDYGWLGFPRHWEHEGDQEPPRRGIGDEYG